MESIDVLRELSDAFGVSGFEDEVREKIASLIEDSVDELSVDPLGNLIAVRRGGERVVMIDAHMDEVGFIVKWIDEKGYLRFAPIGGWDERIIPGHRVEILTRSGDKRYGVIGTAPPHILTEEERKRPIPIERMFIDVGAASKQEITELGIRIGDPLTIHYPFMDLPGGYVTGKAFDDRAGCTVAIQVARRLVGLDLPYTLAFAFTFGEEVGLRGARTAAFSIEPDLALALEGTIGADMPGVPEESQPVRLGRGPAISVADRSIIVSRRVIEGLE
ncbi:MAG TPA: M42 family peptidase, partial [Candidatus Acetothermia bacterium]|nr:M42 family peptidase [Candidatus Acetothermia bacterium]